MTILDSFFLLFEADASKLEKGLDEVDKRTKKTTDDVEALDKAAYQMGERFGSALRTLGGAVLGLVAARQLLSSFNDAVTFADKLDESATAMGVAIETLSAYSDAVKEAGGTSEGLQGSVRSLNQSIAMFATTGKSKASPFLKEMGIDLANVRNKGKTAFDFLPQIADAFEKMGKQESLAMGQKIGFDVGTIMMLQGGRRELDALVKKHKELGVVTKAQGEITAKYNDSLDDFQHSVRSVWLSVAEAVLPPITRIVNALTDLVVWARENHHFVTGIFLAIGAVITSVLLPSMIRLAVATALAFAPYLLIGAVVAGVAAAFALLYDDVMNFLEGNDSLIGQLLEKFPMLAQVFYIIGAVAEEIAGVIKAAFELAGEGILAMWDHIKERVMALWGYVKEFGSSIGGILGKVGGALMSHQFGGVDIAPGVAAGQALLGAAGASPINSQTSSSVTSRRGGDKTSNVNVGAVNVHTQAIDAVGISKAVGGTMASQLSQAAANSDDGVLA